MPWSWAQQGLAALLLLPGSLTLAAAQDVSPTHAARPQDTISVHSAWFAGERIQLRSVPAGKLEHGFSWGPWAFGARISGEKPHDLRPNLYLLLPGSLNHDPSAPDFDHGAVTSALPGAASPASSPPPEPQPVEWDVFWAIVLDPSLEADFRSERELLLAAQTAFVPSDLLEFSDLPGHFALERLLKIHSLRNLTYFRRKDGSFPRLLLVPAGFAVRATAAPAAKATD